MFIMYFLCSTLIFSINTMEVSQKEIEAEQTRFYCLAEHFDCIDWEIKRNKNYQLVSPLECLRFLMFEKLDQFYYLQTVENFTIYTAISAKVIENFIAEHLQKPSVDESARSYDFRNVFWGTRTLILELTEYPQLFNPAEYQAIIELSIAIHRLLISTPSGALKLPDIIINKIMDFHNHFLHVHSRFVWLKKHIPLYQNTVLKNCDSRYQLNKN